MELAFESEKLRDICERESEAARKLGSTAAGMLRHRLADLEAAKSAKDLLAGQPRVAPDGVTMIIELSDGYKLAFVPNHLLNPTSSAGKIDWAKVSRVRIVSIDHESA